MTNESKHTAAPWQVVDDRQILAGDKYIAEVGDTYEGLEGSDEEADANAVLIGAAPDLLQACVELVRLWENRRPVKHTDEAAQSVIAAVAKATWGYDSDIIERPST